MAYTKKWTEKEKAFLIKNYPTKGIVFVTKILNKTKNAVTSQAMRLGIKVEREIHRLHISQSRPAKYKPDNKK